MTDIDTTTIPRRTEFRMPPAQLGGIVADELGQLLSEAAATSQRHRALSAEVKRLVQAEHDAERSDTDALARAIRAGEPDPGPVETERVKAELDATRRQLAAVERLRDTVRGDMRAMLQARRADWLLDCASREAAARADLAKRLEQVTAVAAEWRDAQAEAGWLQGQHKGAATPTVPGLVNGAGQPLRLDAVLAGLAALSQQ